MTQKKSDVKVEKMNVPERIGPWEFHKDEQGRFYMVNKETGEVRNKMAWSQMDADLREKKYERNELPSMTVPNQSMTVKQMVDRHRRGLPIDQAKGAQYREGEDLVQNMDHMDEIDRAAYLDSVADQLVEIRMRLAESAKTKEQQDFLKKVDQEVKDRLQKIRENTKNISDIEEIE